MGYCADGSGFATLKRDADIAELKDKLDALDVRFDWSIDKDSVDFYESDKYHEDATIEFLDTLAPYVAEGEANYTGEDGCAWRFRFDPVEHFLVLLVTFFWTAEQPCFYFPVAGHYVSPQSVVTK